MYKRLTFSYRYVCQLAGVQPKKNCRNQEKSSLLFFPLLPMKHCKLTRQDSLKETKVPLQRLTRHRCFKVTIPEVDRILIIHVRVSIGTVTTQASPIENPKVSPEAMKQAKWRSQTRQGGYFLFNLFKRGNIYFAARYYPSFLYCLMACKLYQSSILIIIPQFPTVRPQLQNQTVSHKRMQILRIPFWSLASILYHQLDPKGCFFFQHGLPMYFLRDSVSLCTIPLKCV